MAKINLNDLDELIKASSNDLEALQGILEGIRDTMDDLKKAYESGEKGVEDYNADMLRLVNIYNKVEDAQKKCIKQQKQEEEALDKQHKKFKDVETSARRYGATLNTVLSSVAAGIEETNPALATVVGSVQKLIPNLVDCFGQFQKLTKSAKAAGIEMNTFGKIMKIATSPSGVLLLITAVVELISYLKSMNTELNVTMKLIDENGDRIKECGHKLNSAAVDLGKLGKAYKDAVANNNVEEFLSKYRKELDATGLSIKSVSDAETFFVKNVDKYVAAVAAKANAERIEKEILEDKNKVTDVQVDAANKVIKAQEKFKQHNSLWSMSKFFGFDKRNINKAKEELDAVDKEVDIFTSGLNERYDELNEAWNKYYEALSGIGLPETGEGNDNTITGPTIDWDAFRDAVDEAYWIIDNEVDLLGSEAERALRKQMEELKDAYNKFMSDWKNDPSNKIKDKLNNNNWLGEVDQEEVDELDPYADVLLPKITEQEKAIYDARLENYSNFISSYADLSESISGMISDNLDAELEAGKITEQEYKRRKKALQAFQISSIVANTASGIVDVWKAYAQERIGNAEAAVATGPAAPATLAALNAKSLTSAILQTATISAAGVAGIASVRSGNLSGASVTPSASISSAPTITYTANQGSNQDVVDAINNNTVQSMQQQVVLVVDDLNKVQSNATKVSVQSTF